MNSYLPFIKKRPLITHNSILKERIFIPGSEWVYFKLYTGTKTADGILKNELYRYVQYLQKSNILYKWFFIRYSDPDFHIRLRLHLKEPNDFNTVYIRFYETFYPNIKAGIIWNIQCDTYKREIERYGVNTIDIIEDIFYIDSEFVIKLLRQIDEGNSEHQRWKVAIMMIDSFLCAIAFSINQRKDLLNMIADNYRKDFGFINHPQKKQLDGKFRTFRKEIEEVMLWDKTLNVTNKTIEIVKSRQEAMIPIIKRLTKMDESGGLEVSMESLLTSIIHMNMNRWFRAKNRLHELVIYDFMARHYTNSVAKQRYNVKSTDSMEPE